MMAGMIVATLESVAGLTVANQVVADRPVEDPATTSCQRSLLVAATGLWGDGEQIELQSDREWLEAIAAEAGFCLRSEQRDMLIARRLVLLESGTVDLLVGASRTPERERYSWFSEPYREEAVRLFVRANELRHYRELNQFKQLLHLPVPWLAVRDSWLGPDYAAARPRLLATEQVFEFDEYGQGLAMLRYGRGELLLAPDTFIDYLARVRARDVISLPTPLHREPVSFMLSKRSVSASELAQFNEALRRIKARGGPALTRQR